MAESEWVIEVANQYFKSGEIGEKKTQSCVVIGGAGTSMTASYCRVEGRVGFKANSSGVWINVEDLSIEQQGISNANTDGSWGDDDWTFQGLYCKASSFSMSVSGDGNWNSNGAVAVTSPVHMSHDTTQSASSHNIWNDAVGSKGWVKLANSISELGSNGTITIYLAGVITFSQTITDAGTASSVAITFTGEEIWKFFDYYPWARRMSGDWKSLNRDGSGQSSTGLFRRENGAWAQVLNGEEDSGKSNGMRRLSGTWSKSSKTGTGA